MVLRLTGWMMDETFQMGESTISIGLKEFCKGVILKFGEQYLNRCPTAEEKARVLSLMRRRGFPGAFNDLRNVQHDDDDNQPDDGDEGDSPRRAQVFQSTFQRGDEEDNGEQVFRSFFQSASEEVASTILAGRIGHMIEDEHKHTIQRLARAHS
jgi:hypothetical protein